MRTNRETATATAYHCAVCGAQHGVALKRYTRTYTPPWVYLALPFALLPAALLAIVISTRHRLAVPFCGPCGRKHSLMPVVNFFAAIGVLAALVTGGGYAITQKSWAPFMFSILLSGVVLAAAARFERNAQPEYLTFDANNVVIRDVVHGRVVLVERYPVRAVPSTFRN